MKCWKCGKEIGDGAALCSNCGANQKRSAPVTKVGLGLRQLYDCYGPGQALSNHLLLSNGIGDVVRDMDPNDIRKLKNRLKSAMDSGMGRLYLEQLNFGAPDKDFDSRVKTVLTEDAGFNEKTASELMGYFDEMIGWRAVGSARPDGNMASEKNVPPDRGRRRISEQESNDGRMREEQRQKSDFGRCVLWSFLISAVPGAVIGIYGFTERNDRIIGDIISGAAIFFCLLLLIAFWKVFQKAGKPGWHTIVPILNIYDYYDIGWKGWIGMLTIFVNMAAGVYDAVISPFSAVSAEITQLISTAGLNPAVVSVPAGKISQLIISAGLDPAAINIPAEFIPWISGILFFLVIIFPLISDYKLAKVFGKGFWFFIGLFLLKPIFIMILAFGSAGPSKKTPQTKHI